MLISFFYLLCLHSYLFAVSLPQRSFTSCRSFIQSVASHMRPWIQFCTLKRKKKQTHKKNGKHRSSNSDETKQVSNWTTQNPSLLIRMCVCVYWLFSVMFLYFFFAHDANSFLLYENLSLTSP